MSRDRGDCPCAHCGRTNALGGQCAPAEQARKVDKPNCVKHDWYGSSPCCHCEAENTFPKADDNRPDIPWTVNQNKSGDGLVMARDIYSKSGFLITHVSGNKSFGTDKDNAKLIVETVNNYATLEATLKETQDKMEKETTARLKAIKDKIEIRSKMGRLRELGNEVGKVWEMYMTRVPKRNPVQLGDVEIKIHALAQALKDSEEVTDSSKSNEKDV